MQEDSIHEAYKLGLGEPIPFSAEHGLGLLDLYDALKPFDRKPAESVLPEEEGETESDVLSQEEKDRLEDENISQGRFSWQLSDDQTSENRH